MNIEIKRILFIKTRAEETLPFGPDTLVYKVAVKFFAGWLEGEELTF